MCATPNLWNLPYSVIYSVVAQKDLIHMGISWLLQSYFLKKRKYEEKVLNFRVGKFFQHSAFIRYLLLACLTFSLS